MREISIGHKVNFGKGGRGRLSRLRYNHSQVRVLPLSQKLRQPKLLQPSDRQRAAPAQGLSTFKAGTEHFRVPKAGQLEVSSVKRQASRAIRSNVNCLVPLEKQTSFLTWERAASDHGSARPVCSALIRNRPRFPDFEGNRNLNQI